MTYEKPIYERLICDGCGVAVLEVEEVLTAAKDWGWRVVGGRHLCHMCRPDSPVEAIQRVRELCDPVAGNRPDTDIAADYSPVPEPHHHEYVQRWVCECGEQNDPVDVTPERPEHSRTDDADDFQCACGDAHADTCQSCPPTGLSHTLLDYACKCGEERVGVGFALEKDGFKHTMWRCQMCCAHGEFLDDECEQCPAPVPAWRRLVDEQHLCPTCRPESPQTYVGQLEAAIKRVRELHTSIRKEHWHHEVGSYWASVCAICGTKYPCDTIRALDGEQ